MDRSEIIKEIESISSEPGFVFILALLIHSNLFYSPEEAADIDWHARLSIQELTFLAGLMVKKQLIIKFPAEKAANSQAERLVELFGKLHSTHMSSFRKALKHSSNGEDNSFENVFRSAELITEPIFYGDSGAYDFQYWEAAPIKYRQDNDWLKDNRNIDIEKAVRISVFLKKLTERKANSIETHHDFESLCDITLSSFIFNSLDLKNIEGLSDDEIQYFLNEFVIKPGFANKAMKETGDYNELYSRPIIQLDDDSYFLPISFNLAQSIYESPFYWMVDDHEYKQRAAEHRGYYAEAFAADALSKVFGKHNVYRSVKIMRNKKETISDVDVLSIAGNKAIILQIKSKKLTIASRMGNMDCIKQDFKVAIQDAYEQGLICRREILNKSNVLINSNGEEIKLSEKIDDAYIICVTSDNYPAVAHQLNMFLKKDLNDPYPVAVNLFDLQILCDYLQDPFNFLYYIRQRINMMDCFKTDNEIACLGYHLKRKLFKSDDYTHVVILSDFAQIIDASYPTLKGYQVKTKASEEIGPLWKNPKFQELEDQIKMARDAGFTDALFMLYDLAGKGADDLIEMIEQTKGKTLRDGKTHSFSMPLSRTKSGITFVSQTNDARHLQDNLVAFSISRKYRSKADIWLGLGSIVGSGNIIDAVTFNKDPWKYNAQEEELANIMLKRGTLKKISGEKIGRNDSCCCGSGKKFKKCCGK